MPSPIAHSIVGYFGYRVLRKRTGTATAIQAGPSPALLLATVSLSLLPDLDWILSIATGDPGRFHNNLTHSLVVGVIVALAVGVAASYRQRSHFTAWFLLVLFCYESHVFMDFFTVGRGVMMFWPLTSRRYQSPLIIFYGLHWSEGLWSWRHLWTFASELFIACLVLLGIGWLAPGSEDSGSSQSLKR